MKRNHIITIVLIALVGLSLNSCSSWRYQNPQGNIAQPSPPENRISPDQVVDVDPVQTSAVNETGEFEPKTIGDPVAKKNTPTITRLRKVNEKKSTPGLITHNTKGKSFFSDFLEHRKMLNDKVGKADHVEKAALSGWVRIMIILFVVGLILILIGIFLSIFISGPFWWLFYAIGALFIVAGFIILILGLVGLI